MHKIIKTIPFAILMMAAIAMAQITLITPNDGAWIYSQQPEFMWEAGFHINSYQIQIADQSNFSSPSIDTIMATTELQVSLDHALPETLYYWHVRQYDPGPGPWSETRSFRVELKGPDPIAPAADAEIFDATPTFIWYELPGASQYRLTVIPSGSVTPVIDDSTLTDTTYTPLTGLAENMYNWQTQAKDSFGNWSHLSDAWAFTLTIIPSGWTQKDSMPTHVLLPKPKYVKDGGSMVGATLPSEDGAFALYAFRGNKSNEYYRYTTSWTPMESLLFGVKPDKPTKINKKKVGKGASLCFDGENTIYATKGNGTREFWAYNIAMNTWTAKPFVPVPKTLKGGTSIAYYDGNVYLLAGGHKPTDPTNFYGYNVEEDTWVALTGVHISPTFKPWKDGSCITHLGSSIYALKGGDKANVFFSYNITGNTWTQAESLPIMDSIFGKYKKVLVKDGGAMTSSEDVIYAVKGAGSNVFWQYAIVGGWTPLESIPRLHKKSVVKTGSSLAYADGKVWILKGNNSPEFWQFQPAITKSKYRY